MALHQGAVPGLSQNLDSILLKWRSDLELHASFFENTRETSDACLIRHSRKLIYELEFKVKLYPLYRKDQGNCSCTKDIAAVPLT